MTQATPAAAITSMTPQQRLESLSLALPPAPKAAGLYKPALVVDRLVYLSGDVLPVS